jgi:hypothetical protein
MCLILYFLHVLNAFKIVVMSSMFGMYVLGVLLHIQLT